MSIAITPVPGSVRGGRIHGNLRVNLLDAATGRAMPGGHISVQPGPKNNSEIHMTTDNLGAATIVNKDFSGPVNITVTCCPDEAFDTLSLIDVDSASLDIPIELRKRRRRVRSRFVLQGITSTDKNFIVNVDDGSLHRKTIAMKDPPDSTLRFHSTVNFAPFCLSVFPENFTRISFAFFNAFPRKGIRNHPIVLRKFAKKHFIGKCDSDKIADAFTEPTEKPVLSCRIYGAMGIAGRLITGQAEFTDENHVAGDYYIIPGIRDTIVELRAVGRKFESAVFRKLSSQSRVDRNIEMLFTFREPPTVSASVLPSGTVEIKWRGVESDLSIVHIRQKKYDYSWDIYVPGNRREVIVPEIPLREAGGLLPGVKYSVRVECLVIPGFSFQAWDWEMIRSSVTHKVVSSPANFQIPVKTPDIP